MRRWNGPTVCLVDMLVSLVAAFLALAILIEEPTKAAEDPSQGEMTAYLFWDDNSNVDIDLWCRAPNDRPVGIATALVVMLIFSGTTLVLVMTLLERTSKKSTSAASSEGNSSVTRTGTETSHNSKKCQFD